MLYIHIVYERHRGNIDLTGKAVSYYRPEGTHTAIYGYHSTTTNPNLLPKGVSGLFLEPIDYTKNPLGALRELRRGFSLSPWDLFISTHQYTTVLKAAEQARVPVYFDDLIVGKPKTLVEKLRGLLTVTPTPPELTYTLREMVCAYKEEFLMRCLGNQLHLARVIGAGHEKGFGRAIQLSSEEKLSVIRNLKHLFARIEQNTVYEIVRLDFNGRRWSLSETIQVPALKTLV